MNRAIIVGIISVMFASAAPRQSAAPFDIIIRNGHIIDGTGSP